MLNTFPSLLAFTLVAPLILRVVAGILFLRSGSERLKDNDILGRAWGILQSAGGILLILGLYTQVTSLVLIVIILTEKLFMAEKPEKRRLDTSTILLIAILISLLLTGAGYYGIDIPV